MKERAHWDLDYDIVVVGYGYAGGVSAITASDAGARVIILEKMVHFGGNSILSGGGCAVADDEQDVLKYLRRTCMDATDDTVLQVFARGMMELPGYLASLAEEMGFETKVEPQRATYPFPGSESIRCTLVSRNEHYQGFPWAKGTKAGGTLFWVVAEHVRQRPIDVRFETPVIDLVMDGEREVLGVVAQTEGEHLNVRARRAVVLCTGGFEHNERLKVQYLQIGNAASMGSLGNTGDGIVMAQTAGAALWHMWHVHGGYGFRLPGLPVAVRHTYGGFRDPGRKMPWIAVDRFGRRFMNEYPPAPQDTPIRCMEYYDPDIQDYPRNPSHLIFDDMGRRLGPIADPKISDERYSFEWSEDNLREVESGLLCCFDTIGALAEHLDIEPDVLDEEIDRWNAWCRRGRDRDFRRPPGTMMAIETPPFYTIPAWPIITNTQGGPEHNAKQQVVDPSGKPIRRLYAAGELGSMFGHLYMLGGNNSECFISGRIAGERAAAEWPWC
jgi:succinate dehydrogenase/fumarate reductase flavoprotein subunit